MAANSVKQKSNRITLNSLVYTTDAANYKDTWKKAVDLYKQGKLFNIVLRGVGSIGDFEISKNRIYSNDAIIEAFSTYNNLINEFPYYRFMFDSHPSSESDEKPEMGEGNSYDSIAAYLLKLRLEDHNINGNTHKVISFDYVITKQSVLDYFMRSIDPIVAISHRGFMGKISTMPREVIKDQLENVTFLNEAFRNLDFWDANSENVDYVEFLRLLGFDLVTYPADFFCVSRKQDIIGFNVSDYDTVKDINNISHNNSIFQYMKDRCANIQSPLGMLRMKVDNNYLMNSIKSNAVLDEVKFILTNGENKMNIMLEKLSDKEYMFGVFEDLNSMFTEVSDIWSLDADKVSDWLDEELNDEFKTKIENRDEFVGSIKSLMDNHEKFADLFAEWSTQKVNDHNSDIVRTMIDAIGIENFSAIMDRNFNLADEDVVKILDEYKETNPELYESVNTNFVTMADDQDYYKEIAASVISSLEPVEDNAPTETEVKNDTDTETPTTDNQEQPAVNEETPVEEPIVDGLKFSSELSTKKWSSKSVSSVCYDTKSKEILGENEFKQLVDDVFALPRSYDSQKCWKLSHHDVVVDGNTVTVSVNKTGLLLAAKALLSPRTSIIATSEEKKLAAQHLKKHFDELKIEAPEGLAQIADNAKFADLVIDSDFVLALDDDFAKKIIDESIKVKAESVDPEAEVISVLDAIYIVMRPFVQDNAKITINEELYQKLAQSINNAAISFAAIMNGEGSEIMNLEDNVIISTMRNQINELKDELSATKDQASLLTNERNDLLSKVSDYETKVTAIGQLSDDVNKATQLVEDNNSLNQAKMKFIFDNRAVIDEDIYKEIMGVKAIDQLDTIGKWVSKMSNKKLTITNKFTDKITPDVSKSTTPTTESQILTPPVADSIEHETPEVDSSLDVILMMIKS